MIEHRAVLSLPGGEPISEAIETYTGEVLAFPPPARRPAIEVWKIAPVGAIATSVQSAYQHQETAVS